MPSLLAYAYLKQQREDVQKEPVKKLFPQLQRRFVDVVHRTVVEEVEVIAVEEEMLCHGSCRLHSVN